MAEGTSRVAVAVVIAVGLVCTFVFFGVGFAVGYHVADDNDSGSSSPPSATTSSPTSLPHYETFAVIDTHTHAWVDCYNATASSGYPNLTVSACAPAPRRYTPEGVLPGSQLLAEWFGNGVSRGVITAVSFMGTDNEYMFEQVARFPEFVRATVAVTDSAGYVDVSGRNFQFPEDLSVWHTKYHVRSLRLNYKNKEDDVLTSLLLAIDPRTNTDALTDEQREQWNNFQTLFAFVRENGWYVDVQHEGEHWARLMPVLLRQECNLIVDHLGRPSYDWREDAGLAAILDSASTGRVWVKASGSYRLKAQDKEEQRQLARTVRDAFGAKKLLWGSDYPYTGCKATVEDPQAAQHCEDSQDYVSLLRTLVDWYEEEEWPLILHYNAAEVFGFDMGEGGIGVNLYEHVNE